MRTVRIIGHRGAPDSAPENTLASFRAAVTAGADVIETDVRLSADGEVMVSHDADYSRLGGSQRSIAACTAEELKSLSLENPAGPPEHPVSMRDVLEAFPEVRFNVDLKDPGPALVRAWAALLEKTGASDRCRTASFRDRSLRIFRRLRPADAVSVARFGIAWLLFLAVFGTSRRPNAREEVMQIPENAGRLKLITPRNLEIWHRHGWRVEVWTIDDEADMRRLAVMGVDGIITNRPSLLRDVLNHLNPGERP